MIRLVILLIYLVDIMTICYMIFQEKRSANSIVAWALFLFLFPIIGLVVYALVGRRIRQDKMYKLKESDIQAYQRIQSDRVKATAKRKLEGSYKYIDMILCLDNMGYAPYRNDADIDLFTDGQALYNQMIQDLKAAKKSIAIQYYIFKQDGLGQEILAVLQEKARQKVEVRLLYDSVGSRTLNKKNLRGLIQAGGKIGEFFPSKIKWINLNMNHRNHRKIVVIDDQIGYVGGFNVGDEYLGKDPKFGYWRDTHIRVRGEAVSDLKLRFIADWKYATKEEVDWIEQPNALTETAKAQEGIQILASGPTGNNQCEIKLGYLKMMQRARKYLYIQSPYLIIDTSVTDALKLAALSGVDVRIMIPGKGDHPFVYWANLSYVGELLKFGIRIYHYDPTAFLHAKTVVLDDEVCSVGTANMDTRSFELNFEVNAFIYSQAVAQAQKEAFIADLSRCTELNLHDYQKRGNGVKLKEGVSQLFALLL